MFEDQYPRTSRRRLCRAASPEFIPVLRLRVLIAGLAIGIALAGAAVLAIHYIDSVFVRLDCAPHGKRIRT